MKRAIIITAAALASLAACGGDDSSATKDGMAGDCVEWTTRAVSADELALSCYVGTHAYGTAVFECADGRTLAWNDFGWGYSGQPFREHAPGAERVAPEAERKTCSAE